MSEPRWIFAYGSLMWNPGVPVAQAQPAVLPGWQRSFCLRSIMHRGSAAQPGLVLGLDAAPQGACRGIALRIAEADWPDAIAAIRQRELVTHAYREISAPIRLDDGPTLTALTYVVRPDHVQYAGSLNPEAQARIIATAVGGRGPNADYLDDLIRHLRAAGLHEPSFLTLQARVRELRGLDAGD